MGTLYLALHKCSSKQQPKARDHLFSAVTKSPLHTVPELPSPVQATCIRAMKVVFMALYKSKFLPV